MRGASIATDYADRVAATREAGCDFALLCNNRDGVIQTIDRLPHAQHQVSAEKWRALQADFSVQGKTTERNALAKDFLHMHIGALQKDTLTNTTIGAENGKN